MEYKSFSAVILQLFSKEEGVFCESSENFAYKAWDLKEVGGEGDRGVILIYISFIILYYIIYIYLIYFKTDKVRNIKWDGWDGWDG